MGHSCKIRLVNCHHFSQREIQNTVFYSHIIFHTHAFLSPDLAPCNTCSSLLYMTDKINWWCIAHKHHHPSNIEFMSVNLPRCDGNEEHGATQQTDWNYNLTSTSKRYSLYWSTTQLRQKIYFFRQFVVDLISWAASWQIAWSSAGKLCTRQKYTRATWEQGGLNSDRHTEHWK